MEADLKFKNTMKFLQEFLLLRKGEYEKEKKALHVIMEEEVQDRMAAATSTHKAEVTLAQDPIPQVVALLHIRLVFPLIYTVSLNILILGNNGMPSYLLLVAPYPWSPCYRLYQLLLTGTLTLYLDNICVTIVTGDLIISVMYKLVGFPSCHILIMRTKIIKQYRVEGIIN